MNEPFERFESRVFKNNKTELCNFLRTSIKNFVSSDENLSIMRVEHKYETYYEVIFTCYFRKTHYSFPVYPGQPQKIFEVKMELDDKEIKKIVVKEVFKFHFNLCGVIKGKRDIQKILLESKLGGSNGEKNEY